MLYFLFLVLSYSSVIKKKKKRINEAASLFLVSEGMCVYYPY